MKTSCYYQDPVVLLPRFPNPEGQWRSRARQPSASISSRGVLSRASRHQAFICRTNSSWTAGSRGIHNTAPRTPQSAGSRFFRTPASTGAPREIAVADITDGVSLRPQPEPERVAAKDLSMGRSVNLAGTPSSSARRRAASSGDWSRNDSSQEALSCGASPASGLLPPLSRPASSR